MIKELADIYAALHLVILSFKVMRDVDAETLIKSLEKSVALMESYIVKMGEE